jgi:hypothetical protein
MPTMPNGMQHLRVLRISPYPIEVLQNRAVSYFHCEIVRKVRERVGRTRYESEGRPRIASRRVWTKGFIIAGSSPPLPPFFKSASTNHFFANRAGFQAYRDTSGITSSTTLQVRFIPAKHSLKGFSLVLHFAKDVWLPGIAHHLSLPA